MAPFVCVCPLSGTPCLRSLDEEDDMFGDDDDSLFEKKSKKKAPSKVGLSLSPA
jgi:hypothetical protein